MTDDALRRLNLQTAVALGMIPTDRPHERDADCAPYLDAETDTCSVCGVYHGDPCPSCEGRGYHRDDCDLENDIVFDGSEQSER